MYANCHGHQWHEIQPNVSNRVSFLHIILSKRCTYIIFDPDLHRWVVRSLPWGAPRPQVAPSSVHDEAAAELGLPQLLKGLATLAANCWPTVFELSPSLQCTFSDNGCQSGLRYFTHVTLYSIFVTPHHVSNSLMSSCVIGLGNAIDSWHPSSASLFKNGRRSGLKLL